MDRAIFKKAHRGFHKGPPRVRYGKGIRGIHLAITSGHEAELKCGFHLVYSDNNKRFSYDRLSACLDIFPIIRSLAETAKVRAVTIQGCLGFDNQASWLFSIETAENLYSFPEISLENVIDSDTARKTVSDWTRRSNEIKKTPLRTMRAFDRD